MSRSNAAAIRRRVTSVLNNPSTPAPTPTSSTTPIQPPTPIVQERPTGLTLQQFISNLDKRVVSLEESLRTTSTTTSSNNTDSDISTLIDEFNSRFEMFATEIADMKDVILKLQSYTMDVNKMLLEERIDILSEVNPNNKSNTVVGDTDLTSVVSIGANTVNTEHTSVDMRELVHNEINKEQDNQA